MKKRKILVSILFFLDNFRSDLNVLDFSKPIICVCGLTKWKRKEKQYDKELLIVIGWKRPRMMSFLAKCYLQRRIMVHSYIISLVLLNLKSLISDRKKSILFYLNPFLLLIPFYYLIGWIVVILNTIAMPFSIPHGVINNFDPDAHIGQKVINFVIIAVLFLPLIAYFAYFMLVSIFTFIAGFIMMIFGELISFGSHKYHYRPIWALSFLFFYITGTIDYDLSH